MHKLISLLIIIFISTSCSKEDDRTLLPDMNAYSAEQNYVLERFQWIGFDPSIIRSENLKDGLGVILGYVISQSISKKYD